MKCRLCGSHQQLKPIFHSQTYEVFRCLNCGFGTLNPIPTESELYTFYNSVAYHKDKSPFEHQADADYKRRYITGFVATGATILDFGCGTGDFIGAMAGNSYDVEGYDVASLTAQKAARKTGCKIASGPLSPTRFPTHAFTAITAFDVIEHIVDFKHTFSYWHRWLKSDGLLFFTTPDLSSWDAKLFGKKWYGFTKIPQHVNYFDRQSIRHILQETGFEVLKMKTWGFSRSIAFIIQRLVGINLEKRLSAFTYLTQHCLYLPMIDVMVLARKVKSG